LARNKPVFYGKNGSSLFVTKYMEWYGYDKEGTVLNLNNLILLVEEAGYEIERLEKYKGQVHLVLEDEAVEKDLM